MNKQDVPAVPDEEKMEELLVKIQPIPSERFHQMMKQAAWRVKGQQPTKNVRLKVAFAIFFLAALAVLFVTPQGRAWAQEVFQFFSRINSFTITLPENQLKAMEDINDSYELPLVPVFIPTVSPEMAALPGCKTPEEAQSYRCQVALAESQLGLDLKEFPEKPEGWRFNSLHFDALSKSATMNYIFDVRYESWGTTYSSLSLMQGIGDFPGFYKNNPWEMVPADKVEVVSVGNAPGEYVQGSFVKPVDRDTLVWDDSNRHQRLAWSDGTRWYLIELWRNLNVPDPLGREGLIELAESLTDSSLETAEPLDPNFLYSVADAEEISGFDLKTPTLLPIETTFSYARYDPSTKQVRVFYGMNHELVIYQSKDRRVDPDTLSTSNPDEIAEVNGEKARFGSGKDSDPYVFLWWQQDGFFYQIYYYEYIGGKLDKEKLVAIAESMQNVNDFRAKDAKPYEYVSIYARALGFNAREFSITPPGWSYVNFWAGPSARCIYLAYASTTEEGDLFINQCGTSKSFDIIDAPAGSIERVRIGRNPGQYFAGAFIPGDNGEMVWDPAAPSKGLFWQDGSLWIHLTLSGNSASLYDKEELILIAESLR